MGNRPFTPRPYARSSRSTNDLRGMDVDLEYGMLEPQTKVELFDVYSGDEDEDDDLGVMGGEFTLAMDLPSSSGAQHAPPFARKRREYDDDEWFSA